MQKPRQSVVVVYRKGYSKASPIARRLTERWWQRVKVWEWNSLRR